MKYFLLSACVLLGCHGQTGDNAKTAEAINSVNHPKRLGIFSQYSWQQLQEFPSGTVQNTQELRKKAPGYRDGSISSRFSDLPLKNWDIAQGFKNPYNSLMELVDYIKSGKKGNLGHEGLAITEKLDLLHSSPDMKQRIERFDFSVVEELGPELVQALDEYQAYGAFHYEMVFRMWMMAEKAVPHLRTNAFLSLQDVKGAITEIYPHAFDKLGEVSLVTQKEDPQKTLSYAVIFSDSFLEKTIALGNKIEAAMEEGEFKLYASLVEERKQLEEKIRLISEKIDALKTKMLQQSESMLWEDFEREVTHLLEKEGSSAVKGITPNHRYLVARRSEELQRDELKVKAHQFFYDRTQQFLAFRYELEVLSRYFPRTTYSLITWIDSALRGDFHYSGSCHGAADAFANAPRAKNAIQLVHQGRRYFFTPTEIDAFTTHIYATQVETETSYIGVRCDKLVGQIQKDETGFPMARECRDVNPASLHIVLTDLVGKQKQSFVSEVFPYEAVWNYGVKSYSWKALPITADDGTVYQAGVPVPVKAIERSYKRIKHLASQTTHVVEVLNTVDFAKRDAAKYRYFLELDKHGQVIGGEWNGMNHTQAPEPGKPYFMDFLWRTAHHNLTDSIYRGKLYQRMLACSLQEVDATQKVTGLQKAVSFVRCPVEEEDMDKLPPEGVKL